MSRRKGSKNARPSYVSSDRIKSWANKLSAMIDDFVTLSLRHYDANKNIDYNRLEDVKRELKWINDNIGKK